MSFKTSVPVELVFPHKTFETEWDVQEEREDLQNMVRSYESKLKMLAAGNVKELLNCRDCEGYEMDPVDVLDMRVEECISNLREFYIELWKLDRLEENWDKRSGDFISLTKEDIERGSLSKEEFEKKIQ